MKLKYASLALFLALCSRTVTAQVTLYSENFNGPSHSFTLNTPDVSSGGTANTWLVNNSYSGGTGSLICLGFPFSFSVASTSSQPVGITGGPNSKYLHICSAAAISSGITNGCFTASDGLCNFDENYFSKMTNDVSTAGMSNVSFNFWWLCGGSATSYGQVYYSTNAGTSWTLLPTQYNNNSAVWTSVALTDPAFDNQTTLRFGFRFVNEITTAATDPGFCVDDVSITYLPACVNTTATYNTTACYSYTVPSGDETYTVSGTYLDTIPNTAGCDSLLTIHVSMLNTSHAFSVNACDSYTVPSGDETYTVAGTYADTIPNTAGCDSILSIQVDFFPVNLTLQYSGGDLTGVSPTSGATYQWVDCANGFAPVSGMTSSSFTPHPGDGSYAVVVTNGPCSDTSACEVISSAGLAAGSGNLPVRFFPNPVNQVLNLELLAPATVTILDMPGNVVLNSALQAGTHTLDVQDLAKGIYCLRIASSGDVYTVLLVKE